MLAVEAKCLSAFVPRPSSFFGEQTGNALCFQSSHPFSFGAFYFSEIGGSGDGKGQLRDSGV